MGRKGRFGLKEEKIRGKWEDITVQLFPVTKITGIKEAHLNISGLHNITSTNRSYSEGSEKINITVSW